MKDISNEIIDNAFEKCVDKFKWPPEISEFKEICMSIKGSQKYPWSEDVMKLTFEKPKISSSNLEVQRIINEGAKICKKLKEIYPELDWYKISDKFTSLKKIGRTYYPNIKEIDMLEKLSNFSILEIKEAVMDKFI